MSSLFNLHQLNLKINEAKIAINPSAVNVFGRWHNLLTTTHKTEEQLQADFLNDIFGEVLGYAYKRGETEINLEKEQKTELDSQKPDGVLGFLNQQNKSLALFQKSQCLEHFETQKQQTIALQNQINQTDAKIDQMVYALYQLTEEEIQVLEEFL
jgi:hypothetical protein